MEKFKFDKNKRVFLLTRRDKFKPILEKAIEIAKSYKKDAKEYKKNRKNIIVSPRDRPINILRRSVYSLACKVNDPKNDRLLLRVVSESVYNRDAKWEHYPRPRSQTAVDWTLRLVRGCLDPAPKTLGVKKQKVLFNDAMLTRLSCELNFALRHRIAADYVTMFIDECGGYSVITAKEKNGGYSLLDQPWISQLQDRWIVSESKNENDAYRGRSSQIPKGVKSTRDDEEWDDWGDDNDGDSQDLQSQKRVNGDHDDEDEEWEENNDGEETSVSTQEGEIVTEQSENDDWEDEWEDE